MPQRKAIDAFDPQEAAYLRAEIDRCAKCGQCRSICPVFLQTGSEGDVSRGRISLAKAMLDGKLGFTKRFRQSFTNCLECLRCDHDCPSGVDHLAILRAVRSGIARQSRRPLSNRLIFKYVVKNRSLFQPALRLARIWQRVVPPASQAPLRHLPYFGMRKNMIPALAPMSMRRKLRKYSQVRRADSGKKQIVIFTGCLVAHVFPEIALDLAAVLERIGFAPVIPAGQVCCGTPLVSMGEDACAAGLAERNQKILSRYPDATVLTLCPSCNLALKTDYPRIHGVKVAQEVYDACEFLAERELHFRKEIQDRIAWHVPCKLKSEKTADATLHTLRAVCGKSNVATVETCCGGGGVLPLRHPEIGDAIGRKTVDSIKAIGAEVAATACPGCMLRLSGELKKDGATIQVKHVVQVIRRSMDTED